MTLKWVPSGTDYPGDERADTALTHGYWSIGRNSEGLWDVVLVAIVDGNTTEVDVASQMTQKKARSVAETFEKDLDWAARNVPGAAAPASSPQEIRAASINVGQRVYEDGMDEFIAVKVWMHGDTVLLVDIDGGEHSLDCDTVVEVEDAEVFTEIEYRYVDGANNKLDETVYFPGLLTEELRDKIEGACKKIDGRLEFIPHQVEPLQDLPALHWGGEYEDDDDWHQLVSMTVVESALQQKLETTTIAELAEQFAAVDKWDDGSAGPWTMDLPGYGSITAYRSEKDGTMVVEIDTPQATVAEGTSTDNGVPLMRVYVNDDAVWEHPPYPQDGEEPIGFHRLEAMRQMGLRLRTTEPPNPS